jgi:RNA polymerase sigma factor (sigma-70 family)
MAIVDRHQEQPIVEILEDLLPRIQHVFSKFHIPPQDAEDVLQQTLLTYLYKRESIQNTERWILGTLRNRCLLYWRDRRRRLYTAVDKALLESVAQSDGCPQERSDLLRDLNVVLAKIPSRCRNLLWLRYRQGYEPPEAARELGYKASSIYKVTERCLAALTKRMVACGLVEEGCDD